MDLTPKFARRLRMSECSSNQLCVPHAFITKYGRRIPSGLRLIVRNGYMKWIDFDLVQEQFIGLRDFYENFGLSSGHTLVFEYAGEFDMKVFICDMHGSEIEYPRILHNLQNSEPVDVSIYDGGWSFVRPLGWGGKVIDSVSVPYEFVHKVGALIPPRVDLVVSSGYRFFGKFAANVNKLSGLKSVCNMLNENDLNIFHLLIFTYDGREKFDITAIDTGHIEAPISPIVSSDGQLWRVGTAFEIVIQQCHLLPHAYGVDIPVQFKQLCSYWFKTDYISAYVGTRCWLLQIRHRRDRKRTTVNDGWVEFKDDLQLGVGDTCIFLWRDDTFRNFNVQLLKKVH